MVLLEATEKFFLRARKRMGPGEFNTKSLFFHAVPLKRAVPCSVDYTIVVNSVEGLGCSA